MEGWVDIVGRKWMGGYIEWMKVDGRMDGWIVGRKWMDEWMVGRKWMDFGQEVD